MNVEYRPSFQLNTINDLWGTIRDRKIPLSIRIKSQTWTDGTNGRVSDLTLAHFLAAGFILAMKPIPSRIKDAVLDSAPQWVKDDINEWNQYLGTPHRRYRALNPEHITTSLTAVAASIAHEYVRIDQNDTGTIRFAQTLLDMSFEDEKLRVEIEKIEPTTMEASEGIVI